MLLGLIEDQSGASAAEYAFALAILAAALVGALSVLKDEIIDVFTTSLNP